MSEIRIQKIDFSLASMVWKAELWPNRVSPIEPLSWIDQSGEINMEMSLGEPSFFAALGSNQQVLGVISGFSTGNRCYRSRGIWVASQVRRMGLGKLLIQQVQQQAMHENCRILWSMPRMTSLDFYLKIGFKQNRILHQYEFGPHAIATKPIDLQNTPI